MIHILTTSAYLAGKPSQHADWVLIQPDSEVAVAFETFIKTYLGDPAQYASQVEVLMRCINQYLEQIHDLQPDDDMSDMLVEIGWLAEEQDHLSEDYVNAQLQGFAGLLAWHVVRQKTADEGITFVDPRDLFLTDDAWLAAKMKEDVCRRRCEASAQEGKTVVTAAHVGITSMNEMTRIEDVADYNTVLG